MRHDGHASDLFVFGGADRQRINIDGQAPRQGRNAIENTGFIFDVRYECLHGFLLLYAVPIWNGILLFDPAP
jgi:hypothetical protein